jgi:hypothetical protein
MKEREMRKKPKFLLRLLSFIFMVALTVLSVAGCSTNGSGGPDFIGTWMGPISLGTMTITFTETTFTSFYNGGSDTESGSGTITSFDTSSKHILLLVATESYTGNPPTTPLVPGDKLYILYSLSGTTLTVAYTKTAYPADVSGGLVLTKQ